MEANKYKEIKKIVIDYLTEVSFKPLLEDNDMIADLYNSGEMNSDDFYKMVEEIKSDALNTYFML